VAGGAGRRGRPRGPRRGSPGAGRGARTTCRCARRQHGPAPRARPRSLLRRTSSPRRCCARPRIAPTSATRSCRATWRRCARCCRRRRSRASRCTPPATSGAGARGWPRASTWPQRGGGGGAAAGAGTAGELLRGAWADDPRRRGSCRAARAAPAPAARELAHTPVAPAPALRPRYVVSHGPGAVYVAFQGTKHLADWAANLRFRHAPLWRPEEEGEQQVRGRRAGRGAGGSRRGALQWGAPAASRAPSQQPAATPHTPRGGRLAPRGASVGRACSEPSALSAARRNAPHPPPRPLSAACSRPPRTAASAAAPCRCRCWSCATPRAPRASA
jgi:hypothetical protein